MSQITPHAMNTSSSSRGSNNKTMATESDKFILAIIDDMITNQNIPVSDKKKFETTLSEQVKTNCVKKNAPKGVAKLKNFSKFDAKLRMRSLVKKGLMTPEGSAIKNNNKETTMNNNFGNSDAQSFRTNSTMSYGAASNRSSRKNSNFTGSQSSVGGSSMRGTTSTNNSNRRRSNLRNLSSSQSSVSSSISSSSSSSSSFKRRRVDPPYSSSSSSSTSSRRQQDMASVAKNKRTNNNRILLDISPSDSFDTPAIRYGKKDLTIQKLDFGPEEQQEPQDHDKNGTNALNSAKRSNNSNSRNSLRSVGKANAGVSQLLSSRKKKTRNNNNNNNNTNHTMSITKDQDNHLQIYDDDSKSNDITTTTTTTTTAVSGARRNAALTNMNMNMLKNMNNVYINNKPKKILRTIFRPQHPLFKPFQKCQSALRKQLSQPYLPESKTLIGIDKERIEVKRLLERTLSDAENNSVLLVGARGGGKSLIVKHVLHSMEKKFTSTTPKKKKSGRSSKKKKKNDGSASSNSNSSSSSSNSNSDRHDSILINNLIAEDPILSSKKQSISRSSSSSSVSSSSSSSKSSGVNRHPRRPLVLRSPRNESGSSSSSRLSLSRNRVSSSNSTSSSKSRKKNKRSRITHPRIYLMGKIKNDDVDFNRLVRKFNGTISQTMNSNVTHIILQNHNIERTPELLENLAKPVLDRDVRHSDRPAHIVSEEWLYANVTAGHAVDETGYEPEDQNFENKYGISIATAISRRRNVGALLQHTVVWISPSVKPGRTDLRRVIANAGGVLLNSLPKPNSLTRNGFVPVPSRNSLADLSPLSPVAYSSRVNNKRLLVIATKEDLENDNASSQVGEMSSSQQSNKTNNSSKKKVIHNSITDRLKALGVGYIYKVEVLLDAILKHQVTLNDKSLMLMTLVENGEIYPHNNQIIPSPKTNKNKNNNNKGEEQNVIDVDADSDNRGDDASSDDDDAGLSKYEKDRLKRIRGNQEFLATLGLKSVRREIADAMGKPPSPKEGASVDDADDADENGDDHDDGNNINDINKGHNQKDDDVLMMNGYNNVGQLSSTAPFVVIRLNGMAHADEKIALREISRQLFLEYESYKIGSRSLSFAHHLQLLLDVLREAKGVCVPMVFILDEFQEFATRSKQTLLYTLLDILQSGETQMAVVGLTEKIDVVESLEKRIQSRFSHRQIFIPPISFENKLDVIKSRLLLSQAFMNNQDNISNDNNNNDDNKNKRGRKKNKRKRTKGKTANAATGGSSGTTTNVSAFAKRWNNEIQDLFKNRDFRDAFKKYHNYGHSVKWFLNASTVALSKLNLVNNERESYAPPFLKLSNFEGSFKDYSVDRRELSFKSLNVVEMLLLISMAHLEKCNSIPYNFELIYEEYVRLLRLEDEGGSIGVSTYTFTKKIMFKAFEQALALGLCKAVGTGSRTRFNGVMAAQKASVNQYDLHYQAVRLILDLKHLKELFRLDNANLPTLVKTWTQKWI